MRRVCPIAVALACFPLALPSPGAAPDRWVPARWQGGPLEADLRARQPSAKADPEISEAVRNWYELSTLDLLRDTPINCLLVTWSAAGASTLESEQQRIVAAYAKEAHVRGIAVLGIVHPGSDLVRLIESARAAGLDGLVLEGDFPDARRLAAAAPFPLITLGSRGGEDSPVAATMDGLTPRARALSEDDAATATPTSEPWIDSNTWLVRSLRAADRRPVWLAHTLEKPSDEDYLRAIADAAVAGGRWVISPDPALIAGLWRKRPEALALWRRVASFLRFFEEHADWRAFEPAGPLGIVYDRAGPNAEVSAEILNLVARRRIPYRVIPRRFFDSDSVRNLSAILATDLAPPTGQEREFLRQFAEQGGLVVAGPSWSSTPPTGADHVVSAAGKGRVVVYAGDPPDLEAVSRNMLSLLGRNNIGIRLFNAPSVLCGVSSADSGRQLLVQLTNYASTPSEALTVRVTGDYRAARLFAPEAAPADMIPEKLEGAVQVRIRRIPVYAALLLER